MVKNVLCCTVGGSHQPIITAIGQLLPHYVCFFCTTGKAGSDRQIRGQGKVIKAQRSDEKASLPNIPSQVGLRTEQFEVVSVPHDDLDTAYAIMARSFKDLIEKFGEIKLYADYTGGTKTMTAALVLTALVYEADLHAVIGQRTNLEKAADGTEWSFPATVEQIQFEREMKQHLAGWHSLQR